MTGEFDIRLARLSKISRMSWFFFLNLILMSRNMTGNGSVCLDPIFQSRWKSVFVLLYYFPHPHTQSKCILSLSQFLLSETVVLAAEELDCPAPNPWPTTSPDIITHHQCPTSPLWWTWLNWSGSDRHVCSWEGLPEAWKQSQLHVNVPVGCVTTCSTITSVCQLC